MNINPGNKNNSTFHREIPASLSDVADEPYQLEIAAMHDDESINLDDALDDDNENPVSQTIVEAAEISGAEKICDTQELEGEEQESKDRVGSLSPLYKET
jgi:hypothetical protein